MDGEHARVFIARYDALRAYSSLPYGGFAGASDVLLSDPVIQTQPARDQLGAYGGIAAYDTDYQTPSSLQYNVAIERQWGSASTITATYVGAHGRRLENHLIAPFVQQTIDARQRTGR